MNKMKLRKIAVSLGLSALMVVGCVFAASAAGLNSNEQKIMDKLSQTITIDGKSAKIPAECESGPQLSHLHCRYHR